MELKYIMEFVELVEVGKFSDAAEQLYISQSSLSKHMKTLEEELGVPLFERETKRKVQLSPFGKLYLPYAEQISILHKEYLALQEKNLLELAATLNIGSIPAMEQYQITDILAKFQSSHLGIILNIEELESALSVEKVLQGKLDFAFVREQKVAENDGLNHVPYADDVLCAVLPASHRLAGQESVSLSQLQHEHFLLLKDSSFMYEMCVNECIHAGFEPNVIYTGSNGNNIVNMVGHGNGIALLTRRPISTNKNPLIRVVDIEPKITTQINLVYRKHGAMSQEAKRLLAFFLAEIDAK